MPENLAAAFIQAQRNFAPALRTSTNPHFRSRYADLSACVEAVIDALHGAGLGLVQRLHESPNGVGVETVLIHESGETLSCGILHVPAARQDPQGYCAAITYARRYSLMAACGIAPEDDDGNAATQAVQTQAKRPQAQAKQQQGADKKAELIALAAEFGVTAEQAINAARLQCGIKTAAELTSAHLDKLRANWAQAESERPATML